MRVRSDMGGKCTMGQGEVIRGGGGKNTRVGVTRGGKAHEGKWPWGEKVGGNSPGGNVRGVSSLFPIDRFDCFEIEIQSPATLLMFSTVSGVDSWHWDNIHVSLTCLARTH